MAYDVITHGGGEGLVYAFNAVASLFNGKKALGASFAVCQGSEERARQIVSGSW